MAQVAEQSRSVGFHRILTLASVVGAAAIYEINMTNAVVVLPHMQGSFSVTHDQISWVVTSFIVGMTMGFAPAGWCSERFGRKPFFIFCLVGYTVASAVCGMATTLYEEVTWRFMQGLIGAPMMPLSLAIVLDNFPRRQHGTANAIWSIGIMMGPTFGPVVGGYIAEFYHWSWVFYFNVPFGAVATLGCWIVLPSTARTERPFLDWLGFTTLIVAAGALQLMLNRGERLDWFESFEIIFEASLVAVCLYVYIVHSLTTRRPFLNLALFRQRNFAAGMLLSLLYGFMLHGVLVLISILLQEVRGYPVITMGTVIGPRGVCVMLGTFTAAWLVKFVDPRYMMMFALICIAVSAWFMSQWTLEVTAWEVAWTGAIQGFANGFGYIALMVKAFSTLERRHRTDAITFLNLMVFTGIGSGIAVAVNIVTRSSSIFHANLAESVTPFNELYRYFSSPEAWDPTSTTGLAALEIEIMRQAAMVGYLNYFYLIAVMAVVCIPLVFLFGKGKVTAENLPYDD